MRLWLWVLAVVCSGVSFAGEAAPAKTPSETYLASFLRPRELVELPTIRRDAGLFAQKTWVVPVQGLQGERIPWPAFYEMTGRRDLASRFRARRTGLWATFGVGVGLLAGGALDAAVGGTVGTPTGCYTISDITARLACLATDDGSSSVGAVRTPYEGYVMLGVGAVLTVVAVAVPLHKLRAHEVRALMLDYDRRLRGELGVDPEDLGASTGGTPAYFTFAPWVGPTPGAAVGVTW
ncbi:MAG: hypothetical protein H6733_05075 [Alphaproteobacteria bacterium]|nr:hypothetical protein [Alphaproteobacteria bacterium]